MLAPPRSARIRSIGAVLAAFVRWSLSIGTDFAMLAAGIFPPLGQRVPDALLVLATAYRTVYAIAGCYLTARLAPNRPMGHALALGLVGLVVSTAGAIATWNAGPGYGPKWYPLALIALAMPGAWLGGKLFRVGAGFKPAFPKD
jgi:hypothetical protein